MADRKCRLCLAFWLLIGAGEASSIRAAIDGPASEARLEESRPPSDQVDIDTLFEGEVRLDRERLVQAVLDRSRTLLSARSALEAALSRPAQARSLADPMVSYTFAPLSISSDAVRYGHVVRFSQRLPYPGKRRLRGAIAEAEAAAAAHDVETLRLHLATVASLLFDDYYVVERAIEINEEHIELLEMFQRIATARYAAGEVSQQAPLQAELEAAHLIHRRVVLDTERALLRTRLNALLHRRPEAPIPPPPEELVVDERVDVVPRGDRIEQALVVRSEVRAAKSDLEARRLEIELSRLDSRPDFEVMGSFNSMWNESDHRLMIGAGVSLPLYRNRWRAAEAEAQAAATAIESEIAGIVDQVRAEVTSADLLVEEAQHVVSLYLARLLPVASDQVSAALAGFRTGRSSFLALIEAERNQRAVRLEYEQARADVYRRRAELNQALGRIPGSGSSGVDSVQVDRIPVENPNVGGNQP